MLRQVALRMIIGHIPPGYLRGMGNTGAPFKPQKLQTGRLDLRKMLSIKKCRLREYLKMKHQLTGSTVNSYQNFKGERTEISRQAVREELVNALGQALPTTPRLPRPQGKALHVVRRKGCAH